MLEYYIYIHTDKSARAADPQTCPSTGRSTTKKSAAESFKGNQRQCAAFRTCSDVTAIFAKSTATTVCPKPIYYSPWQPPRRKPGRF